MTSIHESPPGIIFKGSANIGQRTLFKDICLIIPANEFTCLLGASGVGKSTVLRLIAGLKTGVEFSGSIVADDGFDIMPRIGYMAQGGGLFPWLNVFENVVLGARLRGEKPDKDQAYHILEQVGLSAHFHKKPAALSGGEQQRVSLARTLMENRPIVLLDEPFSALDAKTRSEMQELAGECLKNHSVLFVTHEPAEAARLSHSIIVMMEYGLENIPTPKQKPVRMVDDKETLVCQGYLYKLLRGKE